MKRFIALLTFIILVAAAVVTFGSEVEYETKKVYFVDSQVFKLIGVRTQITKADPQYQAREMIDILINGHDENKKIKRVIPNVKNGLSVKVKDNIAYVDIKQKLVDAQEKGRDIELLMVYSIVNSLTGIDGIDLVRFTIGGRTSKDFMGFIDMREPYIADYMY